MDLNIASLEGQLTEIVQSHQSNAASLPKVEKVDLPEQSQEYIRLMEAREAGVEGEYLTAQAENMNRFVKELELDIKFKVEVSESGYFKVSVLDEDNKVIKTIPGEAFVETREKIRTQIKGLLEDSHN